MFFVSHKHNTAQVADVWLVLVAGFKALADERHGQLKTHSLHGELVFNLSGSRHVGSHKEYIFLINIYAEGCPQQD